MKKLLLRAVVPAVILLIGSGVQAATLTLSDLSSDSTPASVLDATMDFSVAGTQLTLIVTNTTSAPNEFRITEVAFNGAANVAGLSLVSATSNTDGDVTGGWSLNNNVGMDGFGKFDFQLIDGTGADPDQIASGENVTFVLNIAGTGPFADTDFIRLSSTPPGSTEALASIKFTGGPGDDSAFGAVVPVPAAAWLFGSALGLMGWIRRRAA